MFFLLTAIYPSLKKRDYSVLSQTSSNYSLAEMHFREKNRTNVTPILKKELQACQSHLDLWKDDEGANSETISRHVKHKKNHKEWSATGFSSTLNFKNRARNLNLFRREIRKKFSYFSVGHMGETGPLGANLYCGCDSKGSETCTEWSIQYKKFSAAGEKYTVQFLFHSS